MSITSSTNAMTYGRGRAGCSMAYGKGRAGCSMTYGRRRAGCSMTYGRGRAGCSMRAGCSRRSLKQLGCSMRAGCSRGCCSPTSCDHPEGSRTAPSPPPPDLPSPPAKTQHAGRVRVRAARGGGGARVRRRTAQHREAPQLRPSRKVSALGAPTWRVLGRFTPRAPRQGGSPRPTPYPPTHTHFFVVDAGWQPESSGEAQSFHHRRVRRVYVRLRHTMWGRAGGQHQVGQAGGHTRWGQSGGVMRVYVHLRHTMRGRTGGQHQVGLVRGCNACVCPPGEAHHVESVRGATPGGVSQGVTLVGVS